MNKKYTIPAFFLLLTVLLTLSFSGCESRLREETVLWVPADEVYILPGDIETEPEPPVADPDEPDPQPVSPETESESETATETETETESESESESETEPAMEDLVAIKSEIRKFLNRSGCNGFLSSTYSNVLSADLRQVLYQLTDNSIGYDDVVSALTDAGVDVRTTVSYMSDGNLNSLLKSLSGYGLGDFSTDLSPYHLSSLGIYYIQHGDSNMQPVQIDSVSYENGIYTVVYSSEEGEWYITNGSDFAASSSMQVTLKRVGENAYQFLSNTALD